MLTTFTVTNLNDATVNGPDNAPGTLRQAIYDANVASDADIIEFAPDLAGDLRLSIADDSAISLSAFVITSPITIRGNAAGITIKRDITAPEMRFFRVALGAELTLDSLNVSSGVARGTNGLPGENGGNAFAGAIYNQGNLQIIASTLYNNVAIGGNTGAGGNSGAAQGGAIFNGGGNLVIRNSTLSGNSASNGSGPLVARSFGGAVYSKNGVLTVDNSTLTNNNAFSGRELYILGVGAGQTALAQIRSSIITRSDATPTVFDVNATDDLDGQVVVTGSNNLIRSQNAFPSITISNEDPLLGALAMNGGPTRTHALPAGSPAIGHGSNPLNLFYDQRGDTYARETGGAIDIGAFELQTITPPNLLGDYNGDQNVDAGDFVIWRKTMGADVPQNTGADGNGSSKIDEGDYEVWRGRFGAPSSASTTVAATQLNSTIAGEQPAASSTQSQDRALLEAIIEFARLRSAKSDLNDDETPLGEQVSRPISRQDRDEALLAITAMQIRPQSPTVAKDIANEVLEPDAGQLAGDAILPPLACFSSTLN